MNITKRQINRFGIRKYDYIKSSNKKDNYIVGKIRKKNTKNYKYICSCLDYFFRQKECKHIKIFKQKERLCKY